MPEALFEGFRKVHRSWGLVSLLWIVNVSTAALLALPLAAMLEDDLRHSQSAVRMLYCHDYPWWSEWSFDREGWSGTFQPDVIGAGFVLKNLDLLLRGRLPAGIFPAPDNGPSPDPAARPPARAKTARTAGWETRAPTAPRPPWRWST